MGRSLDNITRLRLLGSSAREVFYAAAGQTVFSLTTVQYGVGTNTLEVFVNGLLAALGSDYTETSSTSFQFTFGLESGDEVWADVSSA
jgi:hypothetical protein